MKKYWNSLDKSYKYEFISTLGTMIVLIVPTFFLLLIISMAILGIHIPKIGKVFMIFSIFILEIPGFTLASSPDFIIRILDFITQKERFHNGKTLRIKK